MDFFTITSSLFFVLNPVGNTPFIVSLLARFDAKQQRRILLREVCFTLLAALIFAFAGEWLIELLAIDRTTVGICGGVILFLIALSMISSHHEQNEAAATEPRLVPIAVPVLAGPSLFAAITIYSEEVANFWMLIAALFVAWLASSLLILVGPTLQRRFGKRGLMVMEQLMGMILIFISLDLLITNLIRFIQERS